MTIELPLFPLHTVLFPGTPIHLHVFERRYEALIGDCMGRRSPFGVVLIRSGMVALGPLPDPHAIGCTARITGLERLGAGRLNVTAVGNERFRIVNLRTNAPYLVADVELMPLARGAPGACRRPERALRVWLGRYLDMLAAASETHEDLSPERLPGDAQVLGYMAASLLPLPPSVKQELLASAHLPALLNEVGRMYRHELPIVEALIAQQSRPEAGPFSLN